MRAEAGLQVPSEDESKAFEEMLWPMLRYQPKEKATAQQVLKSEWTKGCLLALGLSISVSRSAKGGERKIQDSSVRSISMLGFCTICLAFVTTDSFVNLRLFVEKCLRRVTISKEDQEKGYH
jgi:hypothetical protein